MRGNGEGKAHVHPCRIALDRRLQESLHAGKRHDLVKARFDLGPAHAENGAVEHDVLGTVELRMEAAADFQQ
jgi:hypothetical protein